MDEVATAAAPAPMPAAQAEPAPVIEQPEADPVAPSVAIGCSLPQGLELTLYRRSEKADGETVAIPIGDPVVLNGANTVPGTGEIRSVIRTEHYGVTMVDADWWAAWLAANPESPALVNGAVWQV